jgi:hypothetical protein
VCSLQRGQPTPQQAHPQFSVDCSFYVWTASITPHPALQLGEALLELVVVVLLLLLKLLLLLLKLLQLLHDRLQCILHCSGEANWCHGRILLSRKFSTPVVHGS